MSILVTGAAGFIGMHVAAALLARGETVVGIDSLSDYYDPSLKQARLACLEAYPAFSFEKLDLADRGALFALVGRHRDIDRVVHLAAQAGVRHSLDAPYAYIEANVMGHLVVMEACRRLPNMRHLVYASSSSVYGGNTKMPFAVEDAVERPVSLYGATKRADELMSACYAHLHGLPMTGLRFFTVYGPWGRPDMSAWLFTEAILNDRPVRLFNHGRMQRDFTFIDDIVAGVVAALDLPPTDDAHLPHRVYNLGNNRPVELMDFVAEIEKACGRQATKVYEDMQPGDVLATYADIGPARRELGFEPATPIECGIPKFVDWFRGFIGP